jgi:hypothetical protein
LAAGEKSSDPRAIRSFDSRIAAQREAQGETICRAVSGRLRQAKGGLLDEESAPLPRLT